MSNKIGETKYGVKMSEVYRMRMTTEQRRLIDDASLAGTASDFWRNYDVFTAEQILKLQAGELTPAEFGSNVASYVEKYLTASLVDDATKP